MNEPLSSHVSNTVPTEADQKHSYEMLGDALRSRPSLAVYPLFLADSPLAVDGLYVCLHTDPVHTMLRFVIDGNTVTWHGEPIGGGSAGLLALAAGLRWMSVRRTAGEVDSMVVLVTQALQRASAGPG